MSEFSNSPLGEDPLGFYEGDPYRARAETGPTSGRGHLRDGRFQANGDMAPQMTYINREREWLGGGQHSYKAYTQNSGYQPMGHLSNNLGRPTIHANNVSSPSGCPESNYASTGHPHNSFMHRNTYTPPRHPETVYPSSDGPKRHPISGYPNSGPGQLNSAPHENGFREDPSCHHRGPPPGIHYSSMNGPPREFWPHMKPHPPQDHTQRAPPPIHDGHGLQPKFRPIHSESKFRPDGPNYRPQSFTNRTRPGGPNLGPEGPGHGPEAWGPQGERPMAPVSRHQPSWEGSDPRCHPQRRISEPNQRKNFIDERRHSYMPLPAPYSPSISSQSSWSPGGDDSPRPRVPLPSPSESSHSMSESPISTHLHCNSKPHGNHVYSSTAQSPTVPGDKERGRELGALRRDGGRVPWTTPPGGKGGREERKPPQQRVSRGHERTPPTTPSGGSGHHTTRDPRQANLSSTKMVSSHTRRVLLEHSYGKKPPEDYKTLPLFRRISPCSSLNPAFLTPLQSSTATKRQSGSAPSTPVGTSGGSKPRAMQKKPEPNHSEKPEHSLLSSPSGISLGDTKPSTDVEGPAPCRSPVRPASASVLESGSGSTGAVDSNHITSRAGGGVQTTCEAVDNSDSVQSTSKSPVIGESVEGKAWVEEEEKKASNVCSLDGFHLDLDPEPTSGSNSNSTCCSESEEMAEEKAEDSDMEVEGGGEGEAGDTAGSSDESLVIPDENTCASVDEMKSPKENQQWSVQSLPEPGKMRFSRMDNMEDSLESERVHLKQMTSNRIQLRNGRVLPPSSLAFIAASQKSVSPPQRQSALLEMVSKSPPSSTSTCSSPGVNRLRRSKRLAGVVGEDSRWKDSSSDVVMDSDSGVDREDGSFEMHLSEESSDESEFDMPDFNPVLRKSSPLDLSPYKPPSESRPVRGKRGRGRGRGGRRGGKRGGVWSSIRSEEDRLESSPHTGVQFYVHEPRTREEDGILQRRLALEMEVKRNERLQSEHSSTVATQEDDRGSIVSEGIPASYSSLDSLHHLPNSPKASSSNGTDFSADLIARVKKISTARSSGDTPLHKCCRTGKYDMVRYLLLVENSPVNVQDNAGWTPLHEATSNGHTDIAELLLQHGADSNASSRDGTRPIHDAIEIGCLDLVKLLIDHKADLMVEYGERTAVEFAMDQNQLEIAEYIKEVIRVRQEKKKSAVSVRSTVHQKTTPTRTSKKLLRQSEDHMPRIPVNGYGPDCVSFGEELDFPLFFVSPIVELSSQPHLPVYNFQISPLGTFNPRRHNFYLMDDLLETLHMKESDFIKECDDVNILELTVAEFIHRLKVPHFNLQFSVPDRVKCLPRNRAVKFIPLCQKLSHMLDIVTENMDN